MPLQIRRADDEAQRLALTVPLKEGEPLWVLETGALYIGDGENPGGIQVNAPIDLSELLPTYQGDLGEIEKDPINQPGVKSSFLTFDGVEANIWLDGQISTDITPRVTETHSLGSGDFRYKKIWVGGEGVAVGEAVITASIGPYIELPAGSEVAGSKIVTESSLSAIFDGGSFNINIIADDDELIVDSENKIFSGNLTGSVIGDDLTVLVDSSNNNISNGTITVSGNSISSSSNVVDFGTNSIRLVREDKVSFIDCDGISTDNFTTSPFVLFNFSRGTIDEPKLSLSGDYIGGFVFRSHNDTIYNASAAIFAVADGDVINDQIPGRIEFKTIDSTGTSFNTTYIDSQGTFSSPVLQTGIYVTTPSDTRPTSPVKGMIIFNDTAGIFEGWNGVEWTALSNPPSP